LSALVAREGVEGGLVLVLDAQAFELAEILAPAGRAAMGQHKVTSCQVREHRGLVSVNESTTHAGGLHA